MVAPGVPDFYQGTELWDLSLVDPDNRRPVDFELRAELLRRCARAVGAEVLARVGFGFAEAVDDGASAGAAPRAPEDFSDREQVSAAGGAGRASGQLLAFRRGENLIAVVPRFTGAQAGDRYRYSVDGGQPLPDPRSRWQPDGVHGSSALVDPEELRKIHASGFRARPLREAVIYELHVGTFTPEGTYQAARQKLAHLVGLGVTHVELLPVASFPGRHGWGYDGVDWYAPQPAYGTPQDLARFVAACHEQGLAVLLDVVYNHFGPDGNYLGRLLRISRIA
jgi:maltooligosyltrehalose synthase